MDFDTRSNGGDLPVNAGCQSIFDTSGEMIFRGDWNPKSLFNVLSSNQTSWSG